MKYRITRTRKQLDFYPFYDRPRRLRLSSRDTLRRRRMREDEIDLGHLFEISDLPSIPKKRKTLRDRLYAAWLALTRPLLGLWRRLVRAHAVRAARRAERRAGRPNRVPMLFGALCGSLCVLLSASALCLWSLFSPYGGSYLTVSVPALVGKDYETLVEDEHFSYVVSFVQNPDVPSGRIVSQSPPAGVRRRLYSQSEDGATCVLTLTVSRKEDAIRLPSLVGLSRRDALLSLDNLGIPYTVEEEYSAAAVGSVCKTLPDASTLWDGKTAVRVTVSLGEPTPMAAVPSVTGLSEAQAAARLSAAGLCVGEVVYLRSDAPVGTVLSQSPTSADRLPLGSSVSLTVSAGRAYSEHRVPTLYGMTVQEAKATLKRYGLTLGEIGGGGETVVRQFPLPDTPITSSVTSVEIYLGS